MFPDALPFDRAAVPPGGNGPPPLLRHALFLHAGLLLLGGLLGLALGGALSSWACAAAPPSFGARADLAVTLPPRAADIPHGAGAVDRSLFDPDALAGQADRRSLAADVVRALVQTDLSEGGRRAGLMGNDAIAAEAVSLAERIALTADADAQTVHIVVSGCPSQRDAVQTAEFAARAFLNQARALLREEERALEAHYGGCATVLQGQLVAALQAEWKFKEERGFRPVGTIHEDMAAKYEGLCEVQATRQESQARLAELDGQLTGTARQFPDAHGEESANSEPVENQRKALQEEQTRIRVILNALEIREASLRGTLAALLSRLPELMREDFAYKRLAGERERIQEALRDASAREQQLRSAAVSGESLVERIGAVSAFAMPLEFPIRPPVCAIIGALLGVLLSTGVSLTVRSRARRRRLGLQGAPLPIT